MVESPVPAASVAAAFLRLAEADQTGISNLQLQKLVHLAQSLSMFRSNVPAFAEPVQAWDNGPVVKPLYGMYKRFVNAPISQSDDGWKSTRAVGTRVDSVIKQVWRVAGSMSGSDLWSLTHNFGPYEAHFVPGIKDIEIPNTEIGRAWPEYVRGAMSMTNPATAAALSAVAGSPLGDLVIDDRPPAETPVLGRGQRDVTTEVQREFIRQNYKPSGRRLRSA